MKKLLLLITVITMSLVVTIEAKEQLWASGKTKRKKRQMLPMRLLPALHFSSHVTESSVDDNTVWLVWDKY